MLVCLYVRECLKGRGCYCVSLQGLCVCVCVCVCVCMLVVVAVEVMRARITRKQLPINNEESPGNDLFIYLFYFFAAEEFVLREPRGRRRTRAEGATDRFPCCRHWPVSV